MGTINNIVGLTADEIDLLNLGSNHAVVKKSVPVYNDAASVTAHSISSEDDSSKMNTDLMSTQVTTLSNASSFSTQTTVGSSIPQSVTGRLSHLKVVQDDYKVVSPVNYNNMKIAERVTSPNFTNMKEMFVIPPDLHPTKYMQPPSDTSSCGSFSEEENDVPHPMELLMLQIESQMKPRNAENGKHLRQFLVGLTFKIVRFSF